MPRSKPKRRRDSNGAAWRKARARVLASEDACALCGRPVDKALPHSDPWSAQVDHIVPVAQGGQLTARSNLQLTHRTCNRTKSDGTGAASKPALKTTRQWH